MVFGVLSYFRVLLMFALEAVWRLTDKSIPLPN